MTGTDCTTPTSGTEAKFVADSITVPTSRTDFAMDLNGDNKPDNQLGNVIAALKTNKIDVQMSIDTSITNGQVVLLVDEKGDNLDNSACAGATVLVGKPTPSGGTPPKFMGSDTLMVDTGVPGGDFAGKIATGAFNSNSPVTTTMPVTATVRLPLVAGTEPITFTVVGAHLQFTKTGDKLTKGQINGAIRAKDVQTEIVPSVANLLTAKIAAAPDDPANQNILAFFDNGGTADTTGTCSGVCKNLNGTCGMAGDMIIQECEVSTNSIIQNVLAPDVQLFSDDGTTYMPNPAKTHPDALSLGLAFTAVAATF